MTGVDTSYAFEIVHPDRPVLSVRRAIERTPVTSSERDSVRRSITQSLREVDPTWRWSGPDIPNRKLAYNDLAVGHDGRIWVDVTPGALSAINLGSACSGAGCRRPAAGASGGAGGRAAASRPNTVSCSTRPTTFHDVFEPDGTYLGRVSVPGGLVVFTRNGNHVWGTVCDDDDVPTVRRYRIDWN